MKLFAHSVLPLYPSASSSIDLELWSYCQAVSSKTFFSFLAAIALY
jgi:hypothetical protein